MYYLVTIIFLILILGLNTYIKSTYYYKCKKICKIYLQFKNNYKYKTEEELLKMTTKEYFNSHSMSRYLSDDSILNSIFSINHQYLKQEDILDLIDTIFNYENVHLEIKASEPDFFSDQWIKYKDKKEKDRIKAYKIVFKK